VRDDEHVTVLEIGGLGEQRRQVVALTDLR